MNLFRIGDNGIFQVDPDLCIQIIDASDPSRTYFGRAESLYGSSQSALLAAYALPVWEIWMVDSSGNKIYANGEAGYLKFIWNNRAGYFQ